jgi:hypothetical protein
MGAWQCRTLRKQDHDMILAMRGSPDAPIPHSHHEDSE